MGLCIIRSVENHHMYQCHAHKQRNRACESQPIFSKQPLRPNIPPAYPEYYDNRREDRTPPTHQQGRLVIAKGSQRRGAGVERHDAMPRPSTSAEGTSEEDGKLGDKGPVGVN